MRLQLKQIILFPALIFLVSGLSACKDRQDTTSLEVHEIFQVEGDEQTKKPTVLKYKDVKQFDNNGILIQQNFYEVDNTLKGYEFIRKEGEKGVTNYYSADSTLLAVYHLRYKDDLIVERIAHDGQTREILRMEEYSHDANGNVTNKNILDSQGTLSSSFQMTYDNAGNETAYIRQDGNGKVLMKEDFMITKTNEQGKWTERWGYRDGMPYTFHRRSFSK